ncbi:MAG: class I SAM-dependent methyltransferase [Cyanobacteriota bacterium]
MPGGLLTSAAMERICEPELMEGEEQVEAYAAADFSSSDQAAVTRILELWAEQGRSTSPERIVDLGCGPGNLTLPLAEHLPQAEVLGLDGSGAMLAEARRRCPGARPAFRKATLPDLPADLGRFELLVSNSLLHHLHDPGVLWAALSALAAPGAVVVVKDLRRPADPEAVEALVQRHAATAPPVLQRDYRASLHAAFRPEEVEQQLLQAGLPLQVRALEDRYLEVWGRLS